MEKVSVIIPCHNCERTISNTLESVLQQQLKNIEIICVNDHSTDQTLRILKKYEQTYPHQVKVVDMINGSSCGMARNLGLTYANGECICFLDSDDMISRNMYLDFYYALKNYQADIVIGNLEIVSNNFNVIKKTESEIPKVYSFFNNPNRLYTQLPSSCTKMFKREILEDETFLAKYYEDFAFTYPILLKSKRVVEFQRADYFYRKNPAGIMSSSQRVTAKILDIIDASLKLKQRCQDLGKYEYYKNYIEDIIRKHLIHTLSYIENWDIDFLEKNLIEQKFQELCECYFQNLSCFTSEIPKILLKDELNLVKKNIIITEKEPEIKRTLIRMIENTGNKLAC